jgi:phosphoglycerate-specific signal transduction histidine kinase
MTIEERFERIEHLTAGLAEERRKDREEYKQLWRDTRRQIDDLTKKIAATNDAITRFAEESREADRRLSERIESVNQHLTGRIDTLVSAIGAFIAAAQKPEST